TRRAGGEDGECVRANGKVGDYPEVDHAGLPVLEVERDRDDAVDTDEDPNGDERSEDRTHSVLPAIPFGMKMRTRMTIPKAMMSRNPAEIQRSEISLAIPMAKAEIARAEIDPTPANKETARMMRICSKPLVVVKAPRTARATPAIPASADDTIQAAFEARRTSTPRDAPRLRSSEVIRMAVPIRVLSRYQAVSSVTTKAAITTIT